MVGEPVTSARRGVAWMRPLCACPAAVAVRRVRRGAARAERGAGLVLVEPARPGYAQVAAVREDPRSPVSVEDGREPAHALRGVPAAHGVEAHVDGFARVALSRRRGLRHGRAGRTWRACPPAPGRGTRYGRRCTHART